jgi:hypothetical protein
MGKEHYLFLQRTRDASFRELSNWILVFSKLWYTVLLDAQSRISKNNFIHFHVFK